MIQGIVLFLAIISMHSFISGDSSYQYPTIDSPGFYRLASNVSNQIIILSSNVSLDMNGCTVSGGANGLVINSGLNNVTIKNGIVSTVASDGIQINGGCANITLDGITIRNALRGVAGDNVTDSMIINCDFLLSNTGIELRDCHNIVLENCIAQTNKYAGFSLISSTTCALLDCKSLSTGQNNTDLVGNIYGFVNSSGSGNIFQRCIANSTQGLTLTAGSSIVAGFALLGTGTQCHSIIDCEAANATSSSSGFTLPYGIYLQGSLNSFTTVTAIVAQGSVGIGNLTKANRASWSPDGNNFIIPFSQATAAALSTGLIQVYSYDRNSNNAQFLNQQSTTASSLAAAWSPGGNYIAVASGDGPAGVACRVSIYIFDPVLQQLRLVTFKNWDTTALNQQAVRALDWTSDGKYLAVGGENSGTSPRWNVKIYRFDSINNSLTETTNISFNSSIGGYDICDVAWTHDMRFLAVSGAEDGTTATASVGIYPFDYSSGTLLTGSLITLSPDPAGTGTTNDTTSGISWSYDDRYLATVSTLNSSANTRVYFFNGTSATLVASIDNTAVLAPASGPSTGTNGASIQWSPDGNYLAVAGVQSTGTTVKIHSFSRGTNILTQLFSFVNGAATTSVTWAPDGTYLLVTGASVTNFIAYTMSGIQFPAGNMITNNKIYCNSGAALINGVGISGSSITNYIADNSSFNNPFNYIFVQNVFNQLFAQGPSLLQNIQADQGVPILTPIDIPQNIDRTRALLQSLVDILI